MRDRILRAGKNLQLVQVVEAGFDCRLEHRAFAEVVKRRELQHVEIGLVGVVKIEHVRQRLSVIFRNVKQSVTSATLLVKVVESWIRNAGGGIQTWRS